MPLRPFTPEELQDLASKGWDVSSYDGSPVNIPDATPQQSTTALGAGTRSALSSALPTLAGGGGFAATMGLLAPETAGASLLAIPAAAGIGYLASKLTGKAQEAVLPESWQQQLSTDYKEHPTASTVGGLTTLPLGGMNLGIANTGKALSAVAKLAGGLERGALSVAERQALINAAGGATIGGGQDLATQALESRDIDPKSVLLSTLVGSIFTKPNAIGKAMGFHAVPERVIDNPEALRKLQQLQMPDVVQQTESTPEVKAPAKVALPVEAKKPSLDDIGRIFWEGATDEAKNIWVGNRQDLKGQLWEQLTPQEKEIIAKNGKFNRQPSAITTAGETAEDLQKQLADSGDVKNQELKQKVTTPLLEEVKAGEQANDIAAKPSKEYSKTLEDELLVAHNIKVTENGELKDFNGNPVRGMAMLPNEVREVVFNPNEASIDTLPHEGLHYFRTELEESAASGDKKATSLLKQWDDASIAGLQEYNKLRELAGRKPVDAHEFAVSEQGLEFVKQQFNLAGETPMKKWWNNTKSLFKQKYSKNATIEDLRRAINYRFVNEQTMGKYVGKSGPLGAVGGSGSFGGGSRSTKNQEYTPEDKTRYDELVTIMKTKPTTETWQELESIKNKYGGKIETSVERSQELSQEDERLLKKQGKEGKTPYPFSFEQFENGQRFNEELNQLSNTDNERWTELNDKNKLSEGLSQDEALEFEELTDKLKVRYGTNAARNQEADKEHYGFFKPLEATFDKVARVDPQLAEAGRRWEARKDQLKAITTTATSDLGQFNRDQVNKVQALMDSAFRSGNNKPLQLQGTDKQIYDVLSSGAYSKYADIRRETGLLIDGRTAGKNVNYIPHQLNDKTLDLFVTKSQSPDAKYAMNKWVEHVVKESKGAITEKEARENIASYINALGGNKDNYTAIQFGAVRKAQGYGLPDFMKETDAIRNLDKYGRRASNDLAMYIELESHPDIANKLHLHNPNTGMFHEGYDKTNTLNSDTNVRNMMKWVTGNWQGTISQSAPKVNALVRTVNNALLGTATGVRNIAQMPVNMVPYIHQFSDLGAMWKGLLATRENSRAALEAGARQPQIDKLQFNELREAPDRFTAVARKVATALRKYQGAELLENVSRDVTFSVGKELAKNKLRGAMAGDKKSAAWLDRFGLLVDHDITKLSGQELESAINQVAKNFTDANQGTYGGRGLPAGIMDSQFAPFWSLQKWSVEKSNTIYKDVVKPFMDGSNRLPLITYTLGTVLSGAAIQQLNELLTNKKGQDPTIAEALDKGDAKAIVSELATLMQLASFGGIIGDGLKFLTDTTLHGKTPRNIVSFPTATAALNLEEKTTDMLEAIRQGENPWDVFKNYSIDLITSQLQAARLIANHTVNEKNVERTDKFRDVRVFNELNGKPAGDIPTTNPYLGIGAREYKREDNLNDALSQLPTLLANAQSRANGNPEELKKQLGNLKGNNYSTMPSLERTPMAFQSYYNFLLRTQGRDVADARLQDYIRQSSINKIKASVIPSF